MATGLTKVNDLQPSRRYEFIASREKEWAPDITEPDFWELLESTWDYTVCGTLALYHLYGSLKYIFDKNVAGDILECGVFLGGSIMFSAKLTHHLDEDPRRRIYALDTFGGFVSRIDGVDVDYTNKAVCHPAAPNYKGFYEESAKNMRSTEFDLERLFIIKGDVKETIPKLEKRSIALLRLDTDTYDTTLYELQSLYPRVSKGGIVIIDDYGFNQGCAKAVMEFTRDKLIFPMRQDRHGRSWVKVD